MNESPQLPSEGSNCSFFTGSSEEPVKAAGHLPWRTAARRGPGPAVSLTTLRCRLGATQDHPAGPGSAPRMRPGAAGKAGGRGGRGPGLASATRSLMTAGKSRSLPALWLLPPSAQGEGLVRYQTPVRACSRACPSTRGRRLGDAHVRGQSRRHRTTACAPCTPPHRSHSRLLLGSRRCAPCGGPGSGCGGRVSRVRCCFARHLGSVCSGPGTLRAPGTRARPRRGRLPGGGPPPFAGPRGLHRRGARSAQTQMRPLFCHRV